MDSATSIECFLGGAGQECLREGWSEIGSDTWTLGHRATIEIPPVERNCDHSLILEIAGVAGPNGRELQRIALSVNEVHVADVVCRGRQQFEFYVPGSALQTDQSIKVAIDLPLACRPIDFGLNDDSRLLALRVVRVLFAPIPPRVFGAAIATARDNGAQREMLLNVHSLGINCEVGFLQRSAGAEPLALFRWTFAPLPKLIHAMEQGFEGLGAPGTLRIELDAESEFVVRDSVYQFQYHSFAYANRGATLETVTRNEYNRLTLLRRTLVEDLQEAKQLFTYHDGGRAGIDDIRRLHRAMSRYGANTLLWICQAPPGPITTAAVEVEPGLIQGFVSGFQLPVDRVKPASAHQDSWMRAITEGYRIWRSRA